MSNHRKFHGLTDWPMTAEAAKTADPVLHSPREGNFHGEEPITAESYHEQCEDIERVRYDVQSRRWPGWWFEKNGIVPGLSPLLKKYLKLSERRPQACARAVRMDHPFELWSKAVIPYLQDQSVQLNQNLRHSAVPFVENLGAQALGEILIWSGMEEVFDVKYAIGQSRLDEYSEFGSDILMYARPPHPEDGAGHGAFSGGAAKAAKLFFSPNEEQVAAIVLATKQFCSFRGFSAQHIWSSNIRGWEIGYRQTVEVAVGRMNQILLGLEK